MTVEEPDVAIEARVDADELRFAAPPEVRTRFPGRGTRESGQATTRRNVPTPVEPGVTYRRVSVRTRISSRLVDDR